MRWLLDTNTCIAVLNRSSEAVVARFSAAAPSRLVVCSVVRAELVFGARKSVRTAEVLDRVESFLSPLVSLPFDDLAADHYGLIRADLERAGTPIGSNDLMIAAIGRAHDLVVVTRNRREFIRVVGLRVEDWHSNPPGDERTAG
jgi:tRNA(fMet)-specific endonuclease VapC